MNAVHVWGLELQPKKVSRLLLVTDGPLLTRFLTSIDTSCVHNVRAFSLTQVKATVKFASQLSSDQAQISTQAENEVNINSVTKCNHKVSVSCEYGLSHDYHIISLEQSCSFQ
jgi:hypothetical protein